MSILPSFLSREVLREAEGEAGVVPVPREYGVDFATGQLTGKTVEGKEAVMVWIWNTLHTERYRYAIYSWMYGVEYEQYIGETVTDAYLQADCRTETEEALLVSPYITQLDDFVAVLEGTKLKVSFTAVTRFGRIEVENSV